MAAKPEIEGGRTIDVLRRQLAAAVAGRDEAQAREAALAEVLQAVNASPGDLKSVFGAMLERAMHLCEAALGIFGGFDGQIFEPIVDRGVPAELISATRQILAPPPNSGLGRIAAGEPVVQLVDLGNTDLYRSGFVGATALVDIGGAKTAIFVALRREEELLGVIVMYRREVRAFSDKQVALLQSFAAQAVIAMENARLLTEQREALEQQTATSEILRIISQSPTDVQPVLDVVASAARRFCGANDVVIGLRDGDELLIAAHEGPLRVPSARRKLDRSSSQGRAVIDARTVHTPDFSKLDPAEWSKALELSREFGFKSAVAAPMLRDGGAIGTIFLRRPETGPFSARQIALLEAFAAQAVIAIENVRLFTELRESLDQQTATSEILRVISQSPTDVQPVLAAVAKAALRFCGAEDVVITLREGDQWLIAGHDGPMLASVGVRQPLTRQTSPGQAMLDGKTSHFPDIAVLDPVEFASAHDFSRRQGFRAALAAPMLREGTPIGAIALRRSRPGAFAVRQIELLESFAAQAVIAFENVRLFTELKQSLDYQTATSEVLEVISRSTSDVQPVLDAMTAAAVRLCGVQTGGLAVRRGDTLHYIALVGQNPEFDRWQRDFPIPVDRGIAAGRAILDRDIVQIVDVMETDDYKAGAPIDRFVADVGGHRTVLHVPLLRDGDAVGLLTVSRRQPEAFAERQIGLIRTFADQAVIAMENARLLSELRERTDDLGESLEYQTATSQVLEVISRSASDIQPVLDTMLAAAARLCEAGIGGVVVKQGNDFWYQALLGGTPELFQALRAQPIKPAQGTVAGHTLLARDVVHVADIHTYPDYSIPEVLKAVHTALGVPLMREGELLGAIVLTRDRVEPFTDRQIALVKTFADQAVIAMENARLLSELRESLDQQTATAEILGVINSSPGNLTPVFQAILEKAHSTCGADMGSLFAWDGTHVRAVATLGYDADIDEILREPHPLIPAMVDLLSGQRVFHRVYEQDRASEGPHPFGPRFLAASRIRTNLIVPLRKDDAVLGFISANRREVRPYSDKEIALLENFAAQAVIAMENARLLGELRESLDQQTATAEVLETINRSQGDLQPVFDTIVSKAMALCDAAFGMFNTFDGERYHTVATRGVPEAYTRFRADNPPDYGPETAPGRLIAGESIIQVADMADSDLYRNGDPNRRSIVDLGGARTILNLALRREGKLLGMIALYRQEVRPFTEQETSLVQGFAAQAVVAMENARLLGELTRREEELRVTFDYMGDGVAMFDAGHKLASWNRNYQELLDIPDDFLATRPGLDEYIRLLAERGELGQGDADEQVAYYRQRVDQQWSTERVRPDGKVIEVRNNPVPGGGAVLIYSDITERKKAEAEIAAARDAAEAALERQTATADILKVIASSPSDTQPAFDAIAESANRLLGGLGTAVWRLDGEVAHLAAFMSINEEADQALRSLSPLRVSDFPALALLKAGKAAQQPDLKSMPKLRELALKRGFRSQLLVPLMAQGVATGFFSVTRATEGRFNEEDVQLLQTFADQAVIAIENARLFNDLRDSLERLKAAQANLVQSEKMASLGQLTAGIAHEIKNPLNFVNNFASLSVELLDELKEVAGPALATLDPDRRAELDETMGLLVGNLVKITEHGKRADGIVRSMLSHSRGGAGDWAPSDINALVEEALNLAYHGARAQDKEFNVTLERDLEKTGKPIEVVPQDVTRVFLNLFGNGFYAANKRRLADKAAGFRPTLKVTTRDLGDSVEVRVRDNGIGMPPEVKEKLFQPFFTTKPTGEGTGLGLSISYDIVTQQHGGTIDVESEPNNYTEFTVRLPRARRIAEATRGS